MKTSTYTTEFKIEKDFDGIIASDFGENYRIYFRTSPNEEWHPDNQSGTLDEADARLTKLAEVFGAIPDFYGALYKALPESTF